MKIAVFVHYLPTEQATPSLVECSQQRNVSLDPNLWLDIPPAIRNEIQGSDGKFPVEIAQRIAKERCAYYDMGTCLLQNGKECLG